MTTRSADRRLRLVPPTSSADAADGAPLIGAVELLPGSIQVALVDTVGRVTARVRTAFPRAAGRTEINEILLEAADACFAGQPPTGIGVAAGGLVDPERGVVIELNEVPALRGYRVAEALAAIHTVPVFVEHRARLQVLGDRWFGAGRGESSFASVSTGETLGVGVLYRGHVLAPDGGRSGAHMTVDRGGLPCTCGARGCWKTLATTPWLRQRAHRAGLGPDMTLARLVELAAHEPPPAHDILIEYAENVALGLVNIQQLSAPALFILHGEAREGGEEFRATIEDRLRVVDAGTGSPRPPRVLIAHTDEDAVALLGGAGLVLSQGLGS